ncbi:MAG: hypothetical protein Q9M27_06675 [Mariprofundaceae bacterium]|jgi:hypothetical protein|nr:hypothetical protein [Mariprofundaceae bacterium]
MTTNTKNLVVGDNYGGCFGLDTNSGKQLIYLGGITWRAINGDKSLEKDSEATTTKALEYINRPSIMMGA